MNTPDIIKEVSRKLRKNMTESEKVIWSILRGKEFGEKFLRQKPIFLYEENHGFPRYVIPDFCSLEKKIVIEIDGRIHNKMEVYLLDIEKEKLLIQKGFRILRIRNEEISVDLERVIEMIKDFIK